jgi:uncharacterized oxidoreductase
MKLENRTVLITGGSSGIGFGLAEAFHSRNGHVILCGRDGKKLTKAKKRLPGIATLKCDVGKRRQREKLAEDVLRGFPGLDILINNAGVQRYIDLTKGYKKLISGEDEIAVNFAAVVELTALFVRHLMKRPSAAVINVSSGLGFMPLPDTPVYNATKAAVHSYSLVLRKQLEGTNVKVFEIVPPMVDTGLNKAGRDRAGMNYRGISVAEYLPSVVAGLENDIDTIFHGDAENLLTEPRGESENRLLSPSW